MPPTTDGSSAHHVAVIGAGCAGLVAARDLSAAGIRVTVLEARDRLGGRTWTRTLAGTDISVEVGGMWFNRELQPAIAAEIERYQLAVSPSEPFERAVWAGSQGRIEGTNVLDTYGPLFAPARGALDEAIEAVRAAYAAGPSAPPEIDGPAAEWIEALDVPVTTKEILLSWVAVIGGGDPAKQSILMLTADLAFTAFAVEDSLEELGESLTNGTAVLVDALAADVRGEIRTASPIADVEHSEAGVTVITADGARLAADAAVVALPLNCLGDVRFDPQLDDPKRSAAAQHHAGASTKVLAIADGFGAATLGAAWGHPLQGAIGMREVGGGTLVTGFDGLASLRDPHDPDEVEQALRVFVPEARVSAVDTHDWIADPYAKGSWLSWPPGWATDVVPGLDRTEGRLAFAGSDTAMEGSGYIEGAVSSGRLAATEVLRVLSAG